jgi:hypothetical protein
MPAGVIALGTQKVWLSGLKPHHNSCVVEVTGGVYYDTSMGHYTWYLVPCNELSLSLINLMRTALS